MAFPFSITSSIALSRLEVVDEALFLAGAFFVVGAFFALPAGRPRLAIVAFFGVAFLGEVAFFTPANLGFVAAFGLAAFVVVRFLEVLALVVDVVDVVDALAVVALPDFVRGLSFRSVLAAMVRFNGSCDSRLIFAFTAIAY